jgi:hypothetical protein
VRREDIRVTATQQESLQESMDLLIRVLKGCPASEELPWLRTPHWDWRGFAAMCDQHDLASLVYCRLRDLGLEIPGALEQHLQTRFLEISARNYVLAKKLIDLTKRFEEDRIPVLAFKGAAVAMVAYGDLALRQFGDLDLIVPQDYLVKAVGAMRRSGFVQVRQGGRPCVIPVMSCPENPRHLELAEEIPFRAPDGTYFVDLHWSVGHGHWRAFSPDIEKVWERTESVTLPHGSVRTLCREDLLLALCSHGTKHRWVCLKWLLDIAQLLRQSSRMNWSRVAEMIACRPQAGVAASLGIVLAEQVFDTPIPAEAGRVLPAIERVRPVAAAIREEIRLNRQNGDNPYRTLLDLEDRPLTRLKIRARVAAGYPYGLLRELIVDVSPRDRAFIALPRYLDFLYHLVRPMRLMIKYSRHAARTLSRAAGRA